VLARVAGPRAMAEGVLIVVRWGGQCHCVLECTQWQPCGTAGLFLRLVVLSVRLVFSVSARTDRTCACCLQVTHDMCCGGHRRLVVCGGHCRSLWSPLQVTLLF
jgi:hypothetical protein